jgi:hypothetical protein
MNQDPAVRRIFALNPDSRTLKSKAKVFPSETLHTF